MARGPLQIEAVDGARADVPELIDSGNVDEGGNPIMVANPLYDSTWLSVEAGNEIARAVSPDPRRGTPQYLVVLDAAAVQKHTDEQAASQAIRDEKDSRTVMVTIDDGVMPKTQETIELQVAANAPKIAMVKARMVAQRGVANPAHVKVETLADYKARQ